MRKAPERGLDAHELIGAYYTFGLSRFYRDYSHPSEFLYLRFAPAQSPPLPGGSPVSEALHLDIFHQPQMSPFFDSLASRSKTVAFMGFKSWWDWGARKLQSGVTAYVILILIVVVFMAIMALISR
jgi:hypothetical protein